MAAAKRLADLYAAADWPHEFIIIFIG